MQKQVTQLFDDLDGQEITSTGRSVGFALEGRSYEIDLSADNLAELREALAPFIQAARTIPSARRGSASTRRK